MTNRNYLNVGNDNIFIDFLKQIVIYERDFEELKLKLSVKSDFIINDLLIIFRYENTETITIASFKNALALFGVYENNNHYRMIFKKFGKIFKRDYLEYISILI